MRIGAIGVVGAIGADCGENPCGFWDFFPVMGPFTSAECRAYAACVATGGAYTPDPSTLPPDLGTVISGNSNSGTSGTGSSVQELQARCAAQGGEWNLLTGMCEEKNWMKYIPWIVGGVALLVIVPPLIRR